MIALTFLVAAAAGLAPPPANGLEAEIPDAIASLVPRDLRSYFLAFLVTPPAAKPMSAELFERHQAYLRKQVEAGYVRLVGPISGSSHLRGMKVISAQSLEDARAIAEEDPAVKEGVLGVEVFSVTLPSLEAVAIRYGPRP